MGDHHVRRVSRNSISERKNGENVHDEDILVPTPSRFEKLYLAPEQAVAGSLRLTFGNPTPVALGGFLLANTPATIMLMGWHGAGSDAGNASAGVGTFYFLGAALLYAGGIGEWILGNTFPSVVFFTFGGFWGAFGATLTPYFNAIAAYDNVDGFYNSFAMFLIFMAVLCFFYAIAALRTNVCLVAILVCFVVTFPCLAGSYFDAASGDLGHSKSLRIIGAGFAFAASLIAWYLWFSMILDSVDFPFSLPVGDLSHIIKGRTKKDVEA